MNMELLVNQYDQLSTTQFDRDILLGVLLRACPESIRQHLTLSVTEGTNYAEVKEKILAYERSSRFWTAGDVMKQLNDRPSTKTTDGPVAMEVDAVTQKGKGKGKGKKGKGKDTSWSWTNWTGWGSWPKGKSKGRGVKGKGKDKGKSKGKGKKGGKSKSKGKGKVNSDRCRICGRAGHWGNECPDRDGGVREVRQESDQRSTVAPSVGGSTAYSSVGASSAAASTTGGRQQVRQVYLYDMKEPCRNNVWHVGTPTSQRPELFTLSEASDNDDWTAWNVRTVTLISTPELFDLRDEEDMSRGVDASFLTDDPFYQWLCNDSGMVELQKDVHFVRTVEQKQSCEGEWIVLDSGADVSLIPSSRVDVGCEVETPQLLLEDAQGNPLRVGGMREAQVEFLNGVPEESMCCLNEAFVVSDVQHVLISFGRMLKSGWFLEEITNKNRKRFSDEAGEECAGLLSSPDRQYRVPVFFRKNSLSVFGHVRKVTKQIHEACGGVVRGVHVAFDCDILSEVKESWQFLPNGNPVHRARTTNFTDPASALSRDEWKFRTTIALIGDTWEVIEHSQDLSVLSTLAGPIPGVLFATWVLTFPQRTMEALSSCMCRPLTESIPSRDPQVDVQVDSVFPTEEAVPYELTSAPELVHGGTAGGHVESPDSVWVAGKELTMASTLKELKEACSFLGLNGGGAKRKLLDRLYNYFESRYQKDVDSSQNYLQQQLQGPRPVLEPSKPEIPEDPIEVERHMATHLPFAGWCDFCIQAKSREDRTLSNADFIEQDTGVPRIQLDWMFLGRSCPALIMLDCNTRFGNIVPAPSKGVYKSVAEAIVQFSLEMNHLQEVVFVMDSEPATVGLLDMAITIRQQMGYKAVKKFGKPYHKGRTARVERYIQSVKRQATTLMLSIEKHVGLLSETHCLRAWSLVRAVFLLNRFHEHTAIKSTPYELLHGRKYVGKILPYGEFVFGLRKPAKVQGTAVWVGGVWVGKDGTDMNVLLTAGGTIHTRSIRRCANPWRADVVASLLDSPWNKSKGGRPIGLLEAPMPVIEESKEGKVEGEIPLLATGEIDQEAAEVMDLLHDAGQLEYEPTEPPQQDELQERHEEVIELEWPDPKRARQEVLFQEELQPLGTEARRQLLGLPSRALEREDAELRSTADKRETEREDDQEESRKVPKRETSPMSGGLYSPFYAGQVELRMPDDDEHWEENADWDNIDWGIVDDMCHGEQPPELSAEDLADLDKQAMKEEVSKLTSMDVVKVVKESSRDSDGKFVDLKEVFDWRYRNDRWKRRCRIVARDFKTGPSTSETFSPTSAGGAIRFFLLFHLVFRWKVLSLDVSDAYLMVPQQEACYVQIRGWIKELLGLATDDLWDLRRVLPGQRNGAQRWFNHFTEFLKSLGFLQCTAMPSVMRHKSRKVVINIHIDDELVAAESMEEAHWFIGELKKKFKVQVEGPFPTGSTGAGEELSYLKKTYVFTGEGILVKPNKKYIESLLKLYDVDNRKYKQVPEHSLLGQVDFSEELDQQKQSLFRSGLGVAMYLAQDRIDIQYCVKTLASSMKCPTQQAEKALIQLILYLAGTRDWVFKLPYVEAGTSLARILNTGRTDEGSSREHFLEIFCDSDWAGGVGRKSTTACVIFLDSVLVTSFSRTQKSIALSSCESEVLALTAGCSEGILLRTIWEFLSQTGCKIVARSDSSSGRQWLARSGVGRLKHFDIRLCWLQSAIHKKVLEVAPIGTKLNVSDLNTKKLSATRKRWVRQSLLNT